MKRNTDLKSSCLTTLMAGKPDSSRTQLIVTAHTFPDDKGFTVNVPYAEHVAKQHLPHTFWKATEIERLQFRTSFR